MSTGTDLVTRSLGTAVAGIDEAVRFLTTDPMGIFDMLWFVPVVVGGFLRQAAMEFGSGALYMSATVAGDNALGDALQTLATVVNPLL